MGVSDIYGASASAAGTAALCSSRAPLGRGEQAKEKPEGARAWMRARLRRAHGRALSKPRSLLAKSRGHGCPRDRGREGALFFGYFLLGKQKKVTGDQGWST